MDSPDAPPSPGTGPGTCCSRLGPLGAALILTALGLTWRIVLSRRYFGAEEEDYGNLGLILGTLQSGFTYVETQHMPLFTSLAAVATAVTGNNAELGGEVVAITAGGLGVGLVTWIGWRWLHPATGILAGLLLAFQPDAALHAATPLRISTYVLLLLGGVALVGSRRFILGGVVLSLGFLTRFDLAFTLLPALVILCISRRDRGLLATTALVASTVT
ncbi:MAG: hypothetical protein VX498_10655, partial [Myxococcota bacterium]|nr:hypothetical protein [Myxococcota bacterium]